MVDVRSKLMNMNTINLLDHQISGKVKMSAACEI